MTDHLNSSLSVLASKVEELDQGTCQGVVIHLQCPYDYCILMNKNITVNSTDEQRVLIALAYSVVSVKMDSVSSWEVQSVSLAQTSIFSS